MYRAFTQHVTSAVAGAYVVFLLHYQPEENTIPRGGAYSQQLNALVKLRSLLPPRVNILVKENKAMFRLPLTLAMSVRSLEFYKAVVSLAGTFLVPLERDTFDLVDNSLAVATITGSVGIEALCRGKRVIVFGNANYRHFAGVVSADTEDVHPAELQALIDGAAHEPAATAVDLMTELCCSLGASSESNSTNARSQQAATLEAFSYLGQRLGQFARAG